MKLTPGIIRVLYRCLIPIRRLRLRNRSVSIISNDCFSSFMYQFYKIPFNSPFVGLMIMPDDYLKLLENPSILETPPAMTTSSHSRYKHIVVDKAEYPLGILPGGIEIHFLHYKSVEEAFDKWTRRLKRLDWNNCIVKFSYNNGCTDDHLKQFDALPFPNKIAFAPHAVEGVESLMVLKEFPPHRQLGKYWKIADFHYNFGSHADNIISRKQ